MFTWELNISIAPTLRNLMVLSAADQAVNRSTVNLEKPSLSPIMRGGKKGLNSDPLHLHLGLIDTNYAPRSVPRGVKRSKPSGVVVGRTVRHAVTPSLRVGVESTAARGNAPLVGLPVDGLGLAPSRTSPADRRRSRRRNRKNHPTGDQSHGCRNGDRSTHETSSPYFVGRRNHAGSCDHQSTRSKGL
jgi:hypothetical protein